MQLGCLVEAVVKLAYTHLPSKDDIPELLGIASRRIRVRHPVNEGIRDADIENSS